MPPADAVSQVGDWPIAVWLGGFVVLIGLLITTVEKVANAFGKVGKAFRNWALTRRRAADEEEEKRIVDMQGQIDYLDTRVLSLLDRATKRDRADEAMYQVLIEHQAWDRKVLATTDAGTSVGPPPPLWPTSIPVNPAP